MLQKNTLLPSSGLKSNLTKSVSVKHKRLRYVVSFNFASAFGYTNVFLTISSLYAFISATLILISYELRTFEYGRIGNLKNDSSDVCYWVLISL
jgi:hypothetical protein